MSRLWRAIVFIFVLIAGGGLAWSFRMGGASQAAGSNPSAKPNVLLISIDTCRADHLSCYGFHRHTTPHIDALASHSTRFENAIAATPITLPSHATMLTGTIPPFHGVHDNADYRLADSHVTIAEILKEQGFATAAFISAIVMKSKYGLDQGFDLYNDHFDQSLETVTVPHRRGDEVSKYALKWLEQHHREPFFLFLHYYDPHWEYQPPEPYASKYADDLYAGEIAYTDACIGQILTRFKELGVYDSTLIVITSDHGEMLGEHGEFTHQYFIYQGVLRVPLIIKQPGQDQANVVKDFVGVVDLLPTICGRLNIEPPQTLQGRDLSAYLDHTKVPEAPAHIYCESLFPTKYGANALLGLVTKQWKYIQTTRPELYDLINDPQETSNLASTQRLQAKVMQEQLRQMLDQWLGQSGERVSSSMDDETKAGLNSIGYVGSARVKEDFAVDQNKDDPKDLVNFHVLYGHLQALQGREELDEAATLCRSMLQRRPGFALGHLAMGEIATAQGDVETARTHLLRAVEIDPDYLNARYNLANLYQSKGQLTEAVSQYLKTLEIDPGYAKAHNNLAEILRTQGKLDDAIQHYRLATQAEPGQAQAHYNWANVLQSMGKHEAAIQQYRQAIKSNSNYFQAYTNLGVALLKLSKTDEAIDHYQLALQIKPDHPQAHYNLANVLSGQGKFDQAIAHYQKAIEAKSDYAKAHFNLANALRRQGQSEEALHHYRQAIEAKPDHVDARLSLAHLLYTQRDWDSAIQHLQQLLQIKPDLAKAHQLLGKVRLAQQNIERAADHFRQALEHDDQMAEAHFGLGMALVMTGASDEALGALRQVIRLKPNWPTPINMLARVLAASPDAALRRPEEAVELAERAVELTQRRNPKALDTLAIAYAATEQFDRAVSVAKEALELATSAAADAQVKSIRAHLELFKQNKPYRMTAPKKTTTEGTGTQK